MGRREVLPLSPCGRGWTRCEASRTGEGSPQRAVLPVDGYPSSGALRAPPSPTRGEGKGEIRTSFNVPAARCVRVVHLVVPRKRGSRECRMRAAPAVSRAKLCKEAAHEHTGQRRTSDIPCAREFMGAKCIDKSTPCGCCAHICVAIPGPWTTARHIDAYRALWRSLVQGTITPQPAENHLRRNARQRRAQHPDLLPRSSLQSPCRDQRRRLGRRCAAVEHRAALHLHTLRPEGRRDPAEVSGGTERDGF